MDEYKILGKRNCDYVNKQGRAVKGINLYCTRKDPHVLGEMCENLYVSTACQDYQACVNYEIGTIIKVSYNRYGQIASVTAKIEK